MASSSDSPSISWRVARGLLYTLLAAVGLFVILTRTEVGRDGIRQQVEAGFADRYQGTLEIERLGGTLLDNITASDVVLRAPSGEPVARADSVVAEAEWMTLLTGRLSLQSLTFVRPRATLHRDSSGIWNVERALQPRVASTDASPLDLQLESVRILQGRLITTRSGQAPSTVRNNWLFDYTRTAIDSLYLQGQVAWGPETRALTLASASFRVPTQNLHLQHAEGQVAQSADGWSFPQLYLETAGMRLETSGAIERVPSDSSEYSADLQIAPSRLNFTELSRLVPRLPLRDTVTVEGRVGGSPSEVVVNTLRLEHGASALELQGTVFGLPDSVDVDASVDEAQLHAADVTTVWPGAPQERLETLSPLTATGDVQGHLAWRNRKRPSFTLQSSFDAGSNAGAVNGTVTVERPPGDRPRYTASLTTDTLNLAAVTGRPTWRTALTGDVSVEGRGTGLNRLRGTASVSLDSSRIGRQRVTRASASVSMAKGTARIDGTVRQRLGGQLNVNGTVGLDRPEPRYTLSAYATNLNLSPAAPALPTTRLNASLTAEGQGLGWQTVTGSARVDVSQSVVLHPTASVPLPAHHITLDLRPPAADSARLQLGGSVADLTLDGNGLQRALAPSVELWATAIRRSTQNALARSTGRLVDTTAATTESPPRLQEAARTALRRAGTTDPLSVDGALTLRQLEVVQAWWPDAPRAARGLRAATELTLSPDSLHATGSAEAAHLNLGAQAFDGLALDYRLFGTLDGPLVETGTANIGVRADTVTIGERTLIEPTATLTFADRRGTLKAQAHRFDATGPFRVDTDLAIDPDQTVFTVQTLFAGMGEHEWRLSEPATITAYTDALIFDRLQLQSPRAGITTPQQIRIHGTLSEVPSDTLYVEAENVLVYPFSELANLPNPFGGRLDGQVSIVGGWTQPRVDAVADVQRLSFDRRVLGDIQIETQYLPPSPNLLVSATLNSAPPSPDSLRGPPMVPNGPRTVEPSQLRVRGSMRVPGLTAPVAPPGTPKPDMFDLTVDVERADLFFFKYIFDDQIARVRGSTSGSIHIGGRFRDPVFDASLTVSDGRFRLPQFGLAYSIAGPVDVDREGIHLRDVTVSDDGGSADINGSILFNDYRFFSFDLSGQLDELTVIDVPDAQTLPFYGTIRASGPVSLTGPLSDATLRSEGARTTPDSELSIPVSEGGVDSDSGFIIFADSTGQVPNLRDLTQRENILSDRPAGEASFVEGLEIDINVIAPEESTVNLVFDPVVGDVVTAVGSGRVQLQRQEGDFLVYGSYTVSGGSYLFTAGEVFVRRFSITDGTITWDGDPTNAQLDLDAEYRTRASPDGLPGYDNYRGRIPVRVGLDITGRVETPQVDLSLGLQRDERGQFIGAQTLDAILNQPDRTTEYATSVLLTNTFLLTTESFTQNGGAGEAGSLTDAGEQLAFNSVSQLVASQLNRYLGAVLPNVELNVGLQGENRNDLDVIYGVALRLLNERLVIRGEGVYTGDDPGQQQAQGPQGEFVVEVRLNRRVSVEVFYRRSGDDLISSQTLTSSAGAGLSYQTEFPTWKTLFYRLFGWLFPSPDEPEPAPDPVAARPADEAVPPSSDDEEEP